MVSFWGMVLGYPSFVFERNIGGFSFGFPMLATEQVLFGCKLEGFGQHQVIWWTFISFDGFHPILGKVDRIQKKFPFILILMRTAMVRYGSNSLGLMSLGREVLWCFTSFSNVLSEGDGSPNGSVGVI